MGVLYRGMQRRHSESREYADGPSFWGQWWELRGQRTWQSLQYGRAPGGASGGALGAARHRLRWVGHQPWHRIHWDDRPSAAGGAADAGSSDILRQVALAEAVGTNSLAGPAQSESRVLQRLRHPPST
mmetsp:Transcript_37221/g.60665  ORF Transcript_37221/g.60665 Transcript_37221/m.60665 type:complete len:128 (+) Transcript_37221:372-755(+)